MDENSIQETSTPCIRRKKQEVGEQYTFLKEIRKLKEYIKECFEYQNEYLGSVIKKTSGIT